MRISSKPMPTKESHALSTLRAQGGLGREPYSNVLFLLRRGLVIGRDRGSSLVFALIFVFVVLATSLMVANRGMLGMVGSFFNQDSKLARDAADIGVLRAAMLLNEPQNRVLLINADSLDGASGADIANSTDNPQFVNPCPDTPLPDVVNSTMGIKVSDETEYPTIAIDDGTATNGIRREFQILEISQQGLPNLEAGTSGGIRIQVQGKAIRVSDGKVLSTSTITRVLEVVPKCCGLSLGGPSNAFGADARQCDAANPGLGLIAGTFFRDNGRFETTGGNGITFTTPDGQPIERVYCLDASDGNDCADGGIRSGTDTVLAEVEPKLKDVPAMPPMTGGATSCEDSTLANCDIVIDDDVVLKTEDFATWGAGIPVVVCTLPGGSGCTQTVTTTTTVTVTSGSVISVPDIRQCEGNNSPVNSGCRNKRDTYTAGTISQTVTTATTTLRTDINVVVTGTSTTVTGGNVQIQNLRSHCFQAVESGTTVTYCSLDTLKIAPSKSLNIDTTGGPIRFYFPNPSSSTSPSVDLGNGNSAIFQTNSSGQTKYSDLAFFGIPRAQTDDKCPISDYPDVCQYAEFGGGTPNTSSFFAYFPTGKSTLIGDATVEGVIWSNVISATGSPNFITSASGIGDVLELVGMDSQSNDDGGPVSILTEYVTRVTRRFSFFGG